MALRFPSLEFIQELQKRSGDKPSSLAPHVQGNALVGLDMDGHTFMADFEDGVCVAAALGGNPIDLDFSLVAPRDVWLALFERIGSAREPGAPHPLSEMIRSNGPIRLESLQDDGEERFASYREAIEAFFDGAQSLQLD